MGITFFTNSAVGSSPAMRAMACDMICHESASNWDPVSSRDPLAVHAAVRCGALSM